jgi:hypothetical protein
VWHGVRFSLENCGDIYFWRGNIWQLCTKKSAELVGRLATPLGRGSFRRWRLAQLIKKTLRSAC